MLLWKINQPLSSQNGELTMLWYKPNQQAAQNDQQLKGYY